MSLPEDIRCNVAVPFPTLAIGSGPIQLSKKNGIWRIGISFVGLNQNDLSGIGLGTFATQNYATPPAIGGTTPAAGNFTTLGATGVTSITNATASTSTTTGALVVTGGVGVSGMVYSSGVTVTNAADVLATVITTGSIQSAGLRLVGQQSGVNSEWDIVASGTGLDTPSLHIAYNGWTNVPLLRISSAGVVSISATTSSTSPTAGALTIAGGLGVGGNVSLSNNQAVLWGSASDYITGSAATHSLALYTNGSNRMGIDQYGQITMLANVSSTSPTTGTLQVTGGIGATGNIVAGGVVYAPTVGTSTVTVAGLPAAGPKAGYRYLVSDATVSTFYSIVIGGGGNVVPVFSDGANWRIG